MQKQTDSIISQCEIFKKTLNYINMVHQPKPDFQTLVFPYIKQHQIQNQKHKQQNLNHERDRQLIYSNQKGQSQLDRGSNQYMIPENDFINTENKLFQTYPAPIQRALPNNQLQQSRSNQVRQQNSYDDKKYTSYLNNPTLSSQSAERNKNISQNPQIQLRQQVFSNESVKREPSLEQVKYIHQITNNPVTKDSNFDSNSQMAKRNLLSQFQNASNQKNSVNQQTLQLAQINTQEQLLQKEDLQSITGSNILKKDHAKTQQNRFNEFQENQQKSDHKKQGAYNNQNQFQQEQQQQQDGFQYEIINNNQKLKSAIKLNKKSSINFEVEQNTQSSWTDEEIVILTEALSSIKLKTQSWKQFFASLTNNFNSLAGVKGYSQRTQEQIMLKIKQDSFTVYKNDKQKQNKLYKNLFEKSATSYH